MRGSTDRQVTMLALVDPDQLIPADHPMRRVKASLLMAFYSIRSERQFCERLQYDLLFKLSLGLKLEDEAFDHSTVPRA
jgi:transposase